MFRSIKINLGRIGYSLFTGLGLLFAVALKKDYGTNEFIVATVITSIILVLEIYMNWRYATKVLRQLDMPNINVYSLWGHVLNHIVLPLLFFYSVAGFVFFNDDDFVRLIAIGFLTIVNAVLLVNIRAYYTDEFKTEENTRYVFDLIKLLSFFFSVNLLLHVQNITEISSWINAIFVCFLSISLGLLLMIRKAQQNLLTVLYVFLTSFIIAVVYMVVTLGNFVLLGVNIIIFLLFYFIYAILHHRLERTLTKEMFAEYCLIFIIAVLVFWGIS